MTLGWSAGTFSIIPVSSSSKGVSPSLRHSPRRFSPPAASDEAIAGDARATRTLAASSRKNGMPLNCNQMLTTEVTASLFFKGVSILGISKSFNRELTPSGGISLIQEGHYCLLQGGGSQAAVDANADTNQINKGDEATLFANNLHPVSFYYDLFTKHVAKYNLNEYSKPWPMRRLKAFADTVDLVETHNKPANVKVSGYTMTYDNQFAHLTKEEWASRYSRGLQPPKDASGRLIRESIRPAPRRSLQSMPRTVNWQTRGGLPPVKNQNSCGSC
jgi:hypothetical protein